MLDHGVLLKLETATQGTDLATIAGKSYTVAKTAATGNGVGKWLVLIPQGGGKVATDGVVVLKVKSGSQLAANLVGKTFSIAQAPVVGQGAGHYLILQPNAASAKALLSSSGAVAPGAASQGLTAKLVNGITAAVPPPVDPTLALAMRGVEVELPEIAAAAKGAAAKGAIGKGVAIKGTTVAAKGVVATPGTGGLATGIATAGTATKSAAAGTIWSGTGTSLGLGLGLGAWGPVILVGALAAVGVGVYNYTKRRKNSTTEFSLVDQ